MGRCLKCQNLMKLCVELIVEQYILLIFAGKVKNVGKVQTLLFSATLPDWVKDVCFYVIISSLC
jgi:hypothetical protein